MPFHPAPCDHCAGSTVFAAEIAPLGSEPGHRVYFCEVCARYTWKTWRAAAVQQQQQQQPPPQKK